MHQMYLRSPSQPFERVHAPSYRILRVWTENTSLRPVCGEADNIQDISMSGKYSVNVLFSSLDQYSWIIQNHDIYELGTRM